MRAFATVLALGFAASAVAVPPTNFKASPRMQVKDPMSLHRRSLPAEIAPSAEVPDLPLAPVVSVDTADLELNVTDNADGELTITAVLSGGPTRLASFLLSVLQNSASSLLPQSGAPWPAYAHSASNQVHAHTTSHSRTKAYVKAHANAKAHAKAMADAEAQAYAEEYYGSYEDEVSEWEQKHPECAEACKVKVVDGATSGKEALCSDEGLDSTLECAQCIDMAWPEEEYKNSAMAEYERITRQCEAAADQRLY